MLDGPSEAVKVTPTVFAVAIATPLQAASARRFLGALAAEAGEPLHESRLGTLHEFLSAEHRSDPSDVARLRLLAADLARLLPRIETMAPSLAPWCQPERAAVAAFGALRAVLAEADLDPGEVELHVVDALPGPYDHARLWAVSLDRADARAWRQPPGIYLRRRWLLPWITELTLGHVLVHNMLGARSPEALGRGLEEGLAEVIGGLYAAGRVAGADPIDDTFRALRITPTLSRARAEHLQAVRACARLHRQIGLNGLLHLVAVGRAAIKETERRLALGAPPGAREPLDLKLDSRLEHLLGAPARPLSVPPLEYLVATELQVGVTLDETARRLALDAPSLHEAARSLAKRTYLTIIGDEGRILAEDLQLVRSMGSLRYDPE